MAETVRVMNTEDGAAWRRRLLSALICLFSLPSVLYWVFILRFKARQDYSLFDQEIGLRLSAAFTRSRPNCDRLLLRARRRGWRRLRFGQRSLWSKLFLGLVVLMLASWPAHFVLQFIGLGYAT